MKIKDLTYFYGYAAIEVRDCIDNLKDKDNPVICKLGNKNYTVLSDTEIDGKLVLKLHSVNKKNKKKKQKFNLDSYNRGLNVAIELINNNPKLTKKQIVRLLTINKV